MKLAFLIACIAAAGLAQAANYPCSKSKGGASHCMGPYFVCNDGSTSQSKKICSASDYEPAKKPPKGKPKQ